MAQSAIQKSASRQPLAITLEIVLALSATVALVALSLFVRVNPQWPIDLQITRDVESINAPWFNFIMHTVGQPGYPPQVYVVLVLLLVILWACKLKWETIMELFAIVGIGIVGLLIKMFVDRARPPTELLNGGTMLDNGKNSFPAGHVESYVAIFGFLMYLSYTLLPKNSITRWLTLSVYGFMLAFIGISRVYLGEHWLTDVIGGYLFGAIWLWLTIKIYEWGKPHFFMKERTRQMANAKAHATQKPKKDNVGDKMEGATRNPWMKALTRYGYFARGILFATIGFLALQVALGQQGSLTDQNGALAAIAAQPFGRILLIVMVIGLIGFSLWGFIRAIFDPLDRGDDKQAIVERIGFVISGISYGALVYPFVQLILGSSSAAPKSQTQTTQDVTAQILAQPFGPWLIGLVGLLVIGWGLGQVYSAYTAKFQKDFEAGKMTATEKKWMVMSGRVGIGARGLVFALIGFFLIQAALRADPKQAIGLDGALLKLAQQPEGTLLLIVAAVGLIVFGIYSMLSARWLQVA